MSATDGQAAAQHNKSSDAHEDAFAEAAPAVRRRRLLTEAIGTFALVLVDCGGAVVAALAPGQVTPEARSLATGLLIMAFVYAMGDVSGAHFNPSVTFAFALRKAFPWSRVPSYFAAQLTGAVLAGLLLRGLFGNVDDLGATKPHFGTSAALVFEIALTFLLVCVVLGTATRHRVVGANAALAAGGTVALCSLFSRPISGASMNPARSLGPALVAHSLHDVWIYLVAPFAGAVLAVIAMGVIHPHKHSEEAAVAAGDK